MNAFTQYSDTVYQIIGAAMDVHNELKWGLAEPIYNEALCLELMDRGITCNHEHPLNCYYKGHLLEKAYRADIVVGDIIIELKSCSELISEHRFQLFNYLRLTNKPIGILINFGSPKLEGERYGYDAATNHCYFLNKNMTPISDIEDYSFFEN